MQAQLSKDREKFRYMTPLQPVDPELQKNQILHKYNTELEKCVLDFTPVMRYRTVSLMKNVSRYFLGCFWLHICDTK